MKQIKIEEKTRSSISAAIDSVEGRASVNCLSFSKLLTLVEHAEKRMKDLGIPVKNRAGAIFHYCPSGPWANSYKYGQGATSVQIIRRTSGWYIKVVVRTTVYPQEKEVVTLMLTEAQKADAVRDFCRAFVTMINPIKATGLLV